MARPLRIEGSSYWYHVMMRGDAGNALFDNVSSCQHFLSLLSKYGTLFNVEVHAYVLMPNHVHLFLCTREPNLGRYIQSLSTAFSVWYNRRNNRSGHVFQGRYKAILVQKDAYGKELSRYIHLNPVRKKSVPHNMKEMCRIVRAYTWSSYGAYIGLHKPPAFLITSLLLESFGKTHAEQKREYQKFVESGLIKDAVDIESKVQAQSVLGNKEFLEKIRHLINRPKCDKSACKNQRKLLSRPLEEVLQAVAELYNINDVAMLKTRKRCYEARRIALWSAAQWCSAYMSLEDIGCEMGGVTASAVHHAVAKLEKEMIHDEAIQSKIKKLKYKFKA